MIFVCEGRSYDTSQMREYDTGDPGLPLIYVTSDGSKVFVVAINRWQGVSIHRALPAEIRHLAERYKLPGLPRPPAPE